MGQTPTKALSFACICFKYERSNDTFNVIFTVYVLIVISWNLQLNHFAKISATVGWRLRCVNSSVIWAKYRPLWISVAHSPMESPPIISKAFNLFVKLGSIRIARAIFVRGPMANSVIVPGCSCVSLSNAVTACSGWHISSHLGNDAGLATPPRPPSPWKCSENTFSPMRLFSAPLKMGICHR